MCKTDNLLEKQKFVSQKKRIWWMLAGNKSTKLIQLHTLYFLETLAMIISWESSKHDQKIAIFNSEILSCLQINILIIATNLKLQTYVDNKPRTEHIYIFTLRMDSYITWKLAIYISRQSTTKYLVLCSVYAQLSWHFPFCKRYFSKLVSLIHSISGKSCNSGSW